MKLGKYKPKKNEGANAPRNFCEQYLSHRTHKSLSRSLSEMLSVDTGVND